jgi:hypothetical protein
MTKVPGRSIASCIADGAGTKRLEQAARIFAKALELCWDSGRRHGDLNFRNILVDLEGKTLALVDPGTCADCCVCRGAANRRAAAISDLGHMVWEAAHDLMDLARGETTRLGNEMFLETTLKTITESMESGQQRRHFIADIWRSAERHVGERLRPSWSPRGIWNGFVGLVARRRIRAILLRVALEQGKNK